MLQKRVESEPCRTQAHTHEHQHLHSTKRSDRKNPTHTNECEALSTKPTATAVCGGHCRLSCSDSGEWIDAIDCQHRRRRHRRRRHRTRQRTTIATINRARSRAHAPHSIARRAQFIMYLCAASVAFVFIAPITHASWRPYVRVRVHFECARMVGAKRQPADRQIIARVRYVRIVHKQTHTQICCVVSHQEFRIPRSYRCDTLPPPPTSTSTPPTPPARSLRASVDEIYL